MTITATNLWRTLELRWFHEGPLPEDVEHWFLRDPRFGYILAPEACERRLEHYLVADTADGLDLKVREGRIQLKQRTGTLPAVSDGQHCAGIPESWTKWVWRCPDLPGAGGASAQDDFTLEVRKVKYQRRIQLVTRGDAKIARFEPEGLGFFVEVATATVSNRTWWTLAFDVEPDLGEGDPAARLREAFLWTLEGYPAGRLHDLQVTNSFSYAALLVGLVGARGRPGIHGQMS
jgi:hypothetical protein